MANKEVGDWNPMEEAHRNPTFNTYVEGPGSHLNTHQQPFNRGARGKNTSSTGYHSNDSEFRLHIGNIPIDMTDDGLKNVLMEYAVPRRVYISDKIKPGFPTTWGTADFVTYGDAEATMRGCNDKAPYKFYIKFATKKNTGNTSNTNANNNSYNERRSSGPGTSSSPRVNYVPLQEVPQKSPGYSEMPRSGANSRPRQPSNSSRDSSYANDTDQAVNRQCKVCLTETSGVCGACKNASYCSQACATADFRRHLPECNVPVPAVLFIEDCNRAVNTPSLGNQKPFPSTPPQNVGPAKNNFQIKNNVSASNNTGIDIGAAGDAHSCPHYAMKKENTSVMGGDSNKDNIPLANGDNKGYSVERKSYAGNPTGWQDKAGNMSSPQQNELSVGRQSSSFNRHANDDATTMTGTDSSFKNKQRIVNENLEVGIATEVEVIFSNIHGVYTFKTSNKPALETMHNGLASNWASMLPFDSQDDICVAPFEGQPYRAKVLQNKSPTHTKLRVKFVDFGNISLFNRNEVKALPVTFLELPAQVLQLLVPDGTADLYSQYEEGTILNVTPIQKVDGSWLVEIHPKQTDDAKSLKLAPTVSPQRQSVPVVGSASPLVPTASPPVASAITVVEEKQMVSTCRPTVFEEKQTVSTSAEVEDSQKNIGMVDNAAGKSCVSEVAPLGVVALVTITHVQLEPIFWGALNSRIEEIEAMEAKMNIYLEANPSPCQPVVNDLVAVNHEDCWYRGKVLKLTPVVKLGLIDYGRAIESPLEKINTLPDELKQVPRHAVKYKVSNAPPGFLQMDKQIYVLRTSTEPAGGCYLVDVDIQAGPCTQQEKKVSAVKVADEGLHRSDLPHAAGLSSLPVQQLPANEYTEVTVIDIAGRSFWVNLTDNVTIALNMLTQLNEHCRANPTPCQPQVGDIVAAPFDNEWYRAKVLTVLPKIRVQYIDYGNESEVSADQVKILPKELTVTPTQAIKITFSKSTSEKYYDLKVDSFVRVKPVPAEKSADGSVVVQVEGDVPLQVKPETPAQESVVLSKSRWSPLLSVEMPSEKFVTLTIGFPGKTGYACFYENIDALNLMMCKLHESMRQKSEVCPPQVGVIVAVVFDNIWHRAKVLTVTPQLQIALVDYGNKCTTTPDKIFKLPKHFYNFPAQAFKIQFMDGTSEEYFNLDESAKFEGKVQQKLPDGTVVLEARNLKINEEAPEPVAQDIEQPPVSAATVPVTASPIKTEMPVTTPQELCCSKVEQLSATSDNQVMVSFTANGQVWVNSVPKNGDLIQMMDTLEHKKGYLQPCNPKVGDYVAVYVAVLEIWHRGKVRSVAPGTVSVFLIDYGCVEDATPDLVKALPEEFTKLPAQGIPVQFCTGSAAKCSNLAVDDIVFLKLLTTTMDGTAVAMGLDK